MVAISRSVSDLWKAYLDTRMATTICCDSSAFEQHNMPARRLHHMVHVLVITEPGKCSYKHVVRSGWL